MNRGDIADVLIIGGGLAGTAWALALALDDNGHPSIIVEARSRLGGLRWFWADHVLPDGTVLVIGFGLAAEIGTHDAAKLAAALGAAFPGADLVDYDWHDRRADPFALGTWVSPSLATLPAQTPEHWQSQGRPAFAGSDLGSAEQGWFEGALLTAERAVADLIPILGTGA